MSITADQLRHATGCSPAAAERFEQPINRACERYEIDTPERLAAFLAQTAHESARFARLVENLNYSATALALTWPRRYRAADGSLNALALQLHRDPPAIANHTYASRLGNGPAESGDGWKYRGRGLIQITGRANYRACGQALGVDLEADPDMLVLPLYAALSAGWYWHRHGLNRLADEGKIELIGRLINGGTHGMAERIALTDRALATLSA